MKLLRHTFEGGSILDFFFFLTEVSRNVCQKNLNTLRNTVERLYLQSIIMGTANISNNKNKTKPFFSCFYHAFFHRVFFLNMILFFKKYNKEIITFLIWEHYHTTYTLGQLIWKCLTKLDTKLILSIWKIKLPQSSHLKKHLWSPKVMIWVFL